MMGPRYLYCRRCDAVIRMGGPYVFPADTEGTATAADESVDFMSRHEGHRIELLTAVPGRATASGPWSDPMVETYHEVTASSGERLVVRGGRKHIDEPRTYRVLPAVLVESEVAVHLDREAARTLVDTALFPHVLPERKRDLVVEALARAVAEIDPAEIEPLADSPDDPETSVAAIPPPAVTAALGQAGNQFDDWERERLACALTAAAADNVALFVRRRFALAPRL